ncbi:MAG: hypothetical protein CM15mP111_0210 [Hyphomicrobiales bacterium]|nr:MAG: hypothetical protein CM15mP111_0210 [Hyphomicrobiales bacterium]
MGQIFERAAENDIDQISYQAKRKNRKEGRMHHISSGILAPKGCDVKSWFNFFKRKGPLGKTGPEPNDIENVLFFFRGSHCHIHMSIKIKVL